MHITAAWLRVSRCTSYKNQPCMWSLVNSPLLLLDEAVSVALFLSISWKHRWEFLVCGKSRIKMVKTAISTNKKLFHFHIFIFFIHISNKKRTHMVLRQGYLLFLPADSFKPVSVSIPGPQLDTRRHCQKKSSMVSVGLRGDPNHQFQFLCLPFLPVISLALHSTGKAASGSQPPHSTLLCLAGSCGFSCCRTWWLCRFLLPVLRVYQPLHQEGPLKSVQMQ